MIVDVFTRSTISRVKSHFTKLGVDNEPVFIGHDRAEKSRIQTRNHALARLSSTDKGAKNEEHISKALLQTEPPEKLRQGARPASSISDYQGDLNGPLEIPSFRANHHNNAHSNNDENTVNRNVRGGEGDKKKARNLTVRPASNIMVPSMKQGSLPPEIKNLQVVPTVDPELVMGKIMARKEKKAAQKAVNSVSKIVAPVAKALKGELRTSKKEMDALKDEMHDTKRAMHAETIAQRRVIRSLASTFESRVEEQHETIKGEIREVVSGALDRLTTALEDIQKVQKENDTDDSDSDSSEDSDGDVSEENEVGRRQAIRRNEVAKVTKNKSSRHASKKNSISQKKSSTVKYDIHGHKIRSKKIRKSRVEYDLNGHVVRKASRRGVSRARP